MRGPVGPVQVVVDDVVTPLACALSGLGIDLKAGNVAATFFQVAADESIGTAQFKNAAALPGFLYEDQVPSIRVLKDGFIVRAISKSARCASHEVLRLIVT